MNETEHIYTWWFDATFIVLRYFLLAGLAYFIFYKWNRSNFSKLRIQAAAPETGSIKKDILFSAITLVIYCTVSKLVFVWYESGITRIYADIESLGSAYFIVSILMMIVLHDAYFYWTHRLMHLPGIYKRVHRLHHSSGNPTPWSAFAFHPVEAIISIGIIPLIVFLFPVHPFALFTFLSVMTMVNVMGHLGYELFSKGFRKNRIGRLQNTATNHNLHHQAYRYNFGLYFTFWDRWMGTFRQDQYL